VTAQWNAWPHDGGPLTVWMTECPGDCSTFTGVNKAEWFKVMEGGMIQGGQYRWATNKMIHADHNSVTIKIPATLKPGNYLIRHELINLARAPPAEFYPECAQLKVTGAGTASPAKAFRATLPGAYKRTDTAFAHQFNTWTPAKAASYVIPGPKVWHGQ